VSRRDKPQKDQREKKNQQTNPTPLITPALERRKIPQQRHYYRYGNQTC